MSEKQTSVQEKISTAAGGAVAAYVVAKAVHDARKQRQAEKVDAEAAAEESRKAAETQSEPTPEPAELSPEEKAKLSSEKGRLASLKTYIGQWIGAPASMRKILPRNGVYHSPWAYHNAPSYASLNLDQSEYNGSGEFRYNSGMEQLVAAGSKPLREALSKSREQHPDSPWATVLSGDDLKPAASFANAEGARAERERIVGLWSAVEGMGFDTRDMAFAQWEDQGARYTVVPYDVKNDLHHVAAGSLADGIDLAKEPGFMLQMEGQRPQDISVSIRTVDIDALRTEMGSDVIPPTPNPTELARQEYRGSAVLPSTPVGL